MIFFNYDFLCLAKEQHIFVENKKEKEKKERKIIKSDSELKNN
jgi:hypothetical protein